MPFFSPPNDLAPDADQTTATIVGWAREAWLRSPASPFFLPVNASGWTYWYAICPDQEQRLWARDLITASLGSWVDFPGQPVAADSDLPMDQAVRALTGPDGCSFRLLVPRNPRAEASVRQSVLATRALAARPYRQTHLSWPLGRLISDLSDACASGSEAGAEQTLVLLEQDYRLSGANKLFLRLQYLAAFARWTDLEESGHLQDLIHLNRPVLASDVLARLVMARLPATASLEQFAESAAEFGCLVGSVTMIRSAGGADQHVLVAAPSSGEAPEAVEARLLDAGWLDQARDHGGVAALLPGTGSSARGPAAAPSLDRLRQALGGGRLDAAIQHARADAALGRPAAGSRRPDHEDPQPAFD